MGSGLASNRTTRISPKKEYIVANSIEDEEEEDVEEAVSSSFLDHSDDIHDVSIEVECARMKTANTTTNRVIRHNESSSGSSSSPTSSSVSNPSSGLSPKYITS